MPDTGSFKMQNKMWANYTGHFAFLTLISHRTVISLKRLDRNERSNESRLDNSEKIKKITQAALILNNRPARKSMLLLYEASISLGINLNSGFVNRG